MTYAICCPKDEVGNNKTDYVLTEMKEMSCKIDCR
jgi:hypothetical protein